MTRRGYVILALMLVIPVLFLATWHVAADAPAGPPQAPAAMDSTITLSALQDSWVNEASPGTNYGSSTFLYVGRAASGNQQRTFVEFDLPSYLRTAQIQSATLEMFVPYSMAAADDEDASGSVDSMQKTFNISTWIVGGAWSQSSITWSNMPTSSPSADPSRNVGTSPGWYGWDVTNTVRGWASGIISNQGFMLRYDGILAGSREFSASRLHVTYRPILPTSTPSRTSTATRTPSPTRTATVTRTPTSPCDASVVILADHDTWTDSTAPTYAGGDDSGLAVGHGAGFQYYSFLHFPFDGVIPSSEYIYDARVWLGVRDVQGDGTGPWSAYYYSLDAPIDEATTTWANQPAPYTYLGVTDVANTSHNQLDVTYLVRRWHAGTETNNGIGIAPLGAGYLLARYKSCEMSGECPSLIVSCGSAPPTATPTRENTATSTSTPTATASPTPPTVNLIPIAIEVTQGVQDLANNVPLLERKRTFVRFYVEAVEQGESIEAGYYSTAELEVRRDGAYLGTVRPINNSLGYIFVQENPDRSILDHAYLFEIPTAFLTGTLTLRAKVNPDWPDVLRETHYLDNDMSVTINFETAPQPAFGLYRIQYDPGDGTLVGPTHSQVTDLLRLTHNIMPMSQAPYFVRTHFWEGGRPDLDDLNSYLLSKYMWNAGHGNLYHVNYPIVRYVGVLDNGGGAGGLSDGIPARVASAWTGRHTTFPHELGHTFDRHHTPFCDAPTGCEWDDIWAEWDCPDGFEWYPYDDGLISPTTVDWLPTAVNGFRYAGGAYTIHSVYSRDLMSYCFADRWPGKFTYERILAYFNRAGSSAAENRMQALATPADYLIVIGQIEPATQAVTLEPMFVIDVSMAQIPEPGDYAIVLRDAGGSELTRHAFTPTTSADDSGCDAGEQGGTLMIGEMVPYHPQTVRVDIEGPAGLLASVTAGAGVPIVAVQSPNGGEVAAGESLLVTWTATDPDGDPMTYSVEYSADDGATWELVASQLTDTSVAIPSAGLPASGQARVRVWASDGIHTGVDESDGAFTVPNHAPIVEIIEPAEDLIAVAGQPIALTALAYDVDAGVSSELPFTWRSDLDGVLGDSETLVTTGLSVGEHLITALADDGAGGIGVDSVQITVYARPGGLPVTPDALDVDPPAIVLNPEIGVHSRQIYVNNAGNSDPLRWSATPSESWIVLSDATGTTPRTIEVAIESTLLDYGEHSGTITFTNLDTPAQQSTVSVTIMLTPLDRFLPMITR